MIVTVTNVKGGCGKTTSCMALAFAAARAGRKVRVIDADAQGSASLWAAVAQDGEEELPFAVLAGNAATLKRLPRSTKEVVVIDCPPQGPVTEAAKDVADFVVVPSGASPLDLQQTWATTEDLERRGSAYAVLLTQLRAGADLVEEAWARLKEQDVGYFEAAIPLREAIKREFGHVWTGEMFGYEDAWHEIEEAVNAG